MTGDRAMRVLMLDPSLFTLPYDRALCGGLADAGCDISLVGRPLRPLEPPAFGDHLTLLPHFYRVTERIAVLRPLHKLAKATEHMIDMMQLPTLCDRLQPDVIHV